MSEGFQLWWVEMEPHVLPLAVALIGLTLAVIAGRLFQKGK
jgi:1,4-dihydroxy-2-naphthoate octaprenyltransferase